MKDFFDLWTLGQNFSFDGATLSAAIKTTFDTRGTTVPNKAPVALTPEFYDDQQKNAQWNAFLNKSKLSAERKSLSEIAAALLEFLMPVFEAVAHGEIHKATWQPGGPWK
jgi:hypothetical protein